MSDVTPRDICHLSANYKSKDLPWSFAAIRQEEVKEFVCLISLFKGIRCLGK